MMTKTTVVMLGILMVFLCCCTENPATVLRGGGSDTEIIGCRLSGIVTDTSGNHIGNVNVNIRKADYLSDVAPDSDDRVTPDAVTKSDGSFMLNPADTGRVVIEAYIDDSLAGSFSLEISADDIFREMTPIVLKPLATITGNIQNATGDSSVTIVKVFGLDRYTYTDSAGDFKMKIPYGSFRLYMADEHMPFNAIDYIEIDAHPGGFLPIGQHLLPLPCFDYSCDSAIVRSILDSVGHDDLHVAEVSDSVEGRIVSLNLRGLGTTIDLRELIRLDHLEEIDIGADDLSSPFGFFAAFPRLRVLRADGNRILLDPAGERLAYLEVLDLSDNNLTNLPMFIVNLQVDSLNVGYNNLCSVDAILADWLSVHDPDWEATQYCQ